MSSSFGLSFKFVIFLYQQKKNDSIDKIYKSEIYKLDGQTNINKQIQCFEYENIINTDGRTDGVNQMTLHLEKPPILDIISCRV